MGGASSPRRCDDRDDTPVHALRRAHSSHLRRLFGRRIRVIDVRHEQTAGHAADGYARVTGRPGVCAVTAGPGVTDVVTAVANAQRAGVPIVVLGGAGPKSLSDMGSLQDMDAVTLMRPITKWSVQVAMSAASESTSRRPSAWRKRMSRGPYFWSCRWTC